jgi:hypothetical protein
MSEVQRLKKKKRTKQRADKTRGEITLGRETLQLTSSPSEISSFSEFTTFSLPF